MRRFTPARIEASWFHSSTLSIWSLENSRPPTRKAAAHMAGRSSEPKCSWTVSSSSAGAVSPSVHLYGRS
jgi:hypothetical protein